MAESVPSILETDAKGEIAEIYADIRKVLGTSVVNLIWRNLATMPGALPWTWSTVRPLYLGAAPLHAEAVRQTIALPDWLAGRPWPGAVHRVMEDGFEQLGWIVALEKRADGLIEARRPAAPEVLVKLRLDADIP